MGVGAESQKSGVASAGGWITEIRNVARETTLKCRSELDQSEITC